MDIQGKRGRKSAASLSVVPIGVSKMLTPPSDLSADEAKVFAKVAGTKPLEWWDDGSVPLLAQYARATVQADRVAELVRVSSGMILDDPDELGRYRELRKIQNAISNELVSLGRAMRLTQQSRYRADKAESTARKGGGMSRPWQTGEVIDGE